MKIYLDFYVALRFIIFTLEVVFTYVLYHCKNNYYVV